MRVYYIIEELAFIDTDHVVGEVVIAELGEESGTYSVTELPKTGELDKRGRRVITCREWRWIRWNSDSLPRI